jgi:hypothetical protein
MVKEHQVGVGNAFGLGRARDGRDWDCNFGTQRRVIKLRQRLPMPWIRAASASTFPWDP